mmetsp:Transcript_17331/g.52387  ORF Transcript_17331/g.52387 Transcript_17331/m.52387 type:complete len:116 (-) Transcript_17331:1189-1536(-)|eukprot:scaffold45866_cov27-Tisochrysis_lutea.AAC.1
MAFYDVLVRLQRKNYEAKDDGSFFTPLMLPHCMSHHHKIAGEQAHTTIPRAACNHLAVSKDAYWLRHSLDVTGPTSPSPTPWRLARSSWRLTATLLAMGLGLESFRSHSLLDFGG